MGKIEVARKTVWNGQTAADVAKAARAISADVVHFHNTFPLISPAAYSAVKREGAAVVQTLHNYRLMCPGATFYRDGHVCEDCMSRSVAWPAIKHGCYRENRKATAAVTAMLTIHGIRGTYRHDVDAYIALTQFSRGKFIEAGFPEDRVFTKPNFVSPDPAAGNGEGGYAVFVGRLTQEKGLRTLLKAWETFGNRLPIKILGDGPLRNEVESAAAKLPGIQYVGRRPINEIYDALGAARILVFPSVWYEGLPRTIVESYAKGTPVVASRLGSMIELIKPGVTGDLFEPGNASALIRQVDNLMGDEARLSSMRLAARREFEEKYTAANNYPELMGIYQRAIERAQSSSKTVQPVSHPRTAVVSGSDGLN